MAERRYTRQATFDALIADYNQGVEPLESWTTIDLATLSELIDQEIQARAERIQDSQIIIDESDIDDYN